MATMSTYERILADVKALRERRGRVFFTGALIQHCLRCDAFLPDDYSDGGNIDTCGDCVRLARAVPK